MMTSSACHIILAALRRELAEEIRLVLGDADAGEAGLEEIFDNVDTAIGRGGRR